jgi:hypothetical protein
VRLTDEPEVDELDCDVDFVSALRAVDPAGRVLPLSVESDADIEVELTGMVFFISPPLSSAFLSSPALRFRFFGPPTDELDEDIEAPEVGQGGGSSPVFSMRLIVRSGAVISTKLLCSLFVSSSKLNNCCAILVPAFFWPFLRP